jgi:zinc protease
MAVWAWLVVAVMGWMSGMRVAAQVVDPLPEVALRDNPAWITGRLPNGVTWYVRQNREPQKRAYLRLIVNAGSTLETEGQRGLAHFVEHMCFNGTESYTGNDLIAFLQSMGTDFGADLNAYTSFDETVYELEIRTDSTGLLDKGLQVLQEWAHKVKFDPEEIDKERGVIMEEKRLRSGAGRRLNEITFPVIYAGSRYPDRFPIGTEEVILKCPYDTLIQYYRDWYRPDLIAVVAVGDFDLQPVIERIQQLFGQLKPHPQPKNRKLFPVPPHTETRAVVATDPEQTLTMVNMQLKRTPTLLRSDLSLIHI